ncbi:hypothetical protein GCM10028819_46970 [Spirosoma humi]
MKALLMFSCVAALVVSLNACNRNSVDPDTADASARLGGVVSTSLTGPHNLTVVEAATLPAAITTYITTNYAGATIKEALKDEKGNFLVAITVNSTLKLLQFKADGTFVKVVEGRPGRPPRDSANHVPSDSAHHPRHPHGDSLSHPKPPKADSANHPRPGKGPDVTTVAVSNLPAAITSYINTTYAGATIDKAVQEKMSGNYLVAITTADKKRVALLFGSDGTFKKAVAGR